ncbi:ADP-ribose pyrophosphatase YjhB (NUDIX family) [Thermosporothrix hazakensis]|jgi:ADP-ribose pyrophosphatase YjhB (NUDIX family)|uniref:ADP-ribose pyrophosphatase YjhB (NUDIX family) n=2 Tax=Thermosporothrix TaxID=768650 RepID=A0A326UP51_THEHA|nr:NUDIX domain-containing protein [Thermosporothrix hazakensis]PZW36029.1 ADP-ribose pyrophosphatase YjhB (NUDIX family) [Thermosporothrix hazakensis]BBH88496.1 DNA mismatch repair protein MutT [Thermosporothrix sp. COM3]GCE46681.1 DNA mismatch repair protein MutT [Thermosporothrix hazakensis]
MESSSLSETHAAYFRIGVSAVIMQEKRVLLALRRDIEWWNLPGGGMEPGETVEQTVLREVREETGLEVAIERLIGVYSKPQKREVVLSFACRVVGGTLHETEESRECRFFAVDALPEKTLPKHRQRIEDALLQQERALLRDQLTTTAEDQGLV